VTVSDGQPIRIELPGSTEPRWRGCHHPGLMTTSALLTVEGTAAARAADVDVVIPVYNEEAQLERSVRRLHSYLAGAFPLSWTITIADNASRDQTWGIACRLASQLDGVRAIHLDQKGRGRALRAAWSVSTARVVAYMDVDLSTDLDALLPLVAPLLSGHSDIAIGSRLASGARVVRGPKREMISRGYNLLLKATLGNTFSDAQCGFKAVPTDVARALLPLVEDNDWFFDTELLVLAEHNGLRIHEVPVDWVDDPDSRVLVTATARDDLKGIWRLVRRFASGRGLLPAGALPDDQTTSGLAGQLVRFASIGATTTALFALLFVALFGPLGPIAADALALGVCATLNTVANRRVTFSRRGRAGRRRQYAAGMMVASVPVVVTVAALLALGALGVTSLLSELVVLSALNAAAAVGRFVLLRHWVFR
jgi:putative flippase GtrA